MFAIEVHSGYMIAEWVEKFQNCRVTKDMDGILRFPTQDDAKAFITKHDGEGLRKKTAKVIPV